MSHRRALTLAIAALAPVIALGTWLGSGGSDATAGHETVAAGRRAFAVTVAAIGAVNELDALEREVRAILDERHAQRSGIATPFVIRNQLVAVRTERGVTRALGRMTVGVASLAVLVGGVGVLAIMLVSVRERVREIGLRRAVGARRDDIRLQFLAESSLLAIVGAVAGAMVGVAGAAMAAILGPWDLVIGWRAPSLAILFSSALGLAAGILPARRAASLEPIDALRG